MRVADGRTNLLHSRSLRRRWYRGRFDTPKGNRSRLVPLKERASRALDEQRHRKGPLVFCREDGSRYPDNHLRAPIRRACKRAGLREVGWHVLRHSFASQVMRGESLKQVQELLGHRDIKTTMRYAHLSPEVKRDAVVLLDRVHRNTTRAAHGTSTPRGATSLDLTPWTNNRKRGAPGTTRTEAVRGSGATVTA